MQDAVLRMLVDKYKPLRSGPIRTADEKLKKAPPQVGTVESGALDTIEALREAVDDSVVVQTSWGASSGRSMADVPLLPHIEGHQPWQTTFTVPSHAQSSIKYGNIPPSPTTSRLPPNPELLDDKAKRKLRESKKRTEQAGRLRNAKESTLDYRLGIKGPKRPEGAVHQRPNPTSLRGWTSLVEDRIEVRTRLSAARFVFSNADSSLESKERRSLRSHTRAGAALEAVCRRAESLYRSRRVSHESHCSTTGCSTSLGRGTTR